MNLHYTLFYARNQFIRSIELGFQVNKMEFFILYLSLTLENNRKFKELLVIGLERFLIE